MMKTYEYSIGAVITHITLDKHHSYNYTEIKLIHIRTRKDNYAHVWIRLNVKYSSSQRDDIICQALYHESSDNYTGNALHKSSYT